MTADVQIAWAAGLFEGEGFFNRREIGGRVYLGIGIEMRDLDVVTRFVDVLRSNGVASARRASGPQHLSAIRLRPRNKQNPKHSDIYVWTTTGHTARAAYVLMRPHLGERRRSRADAILAEADAITIALAAPRPCRHCGRLFTLNPYGRARQFCSTLCYTRAKIERPGQREAARERDRRYRERKRNAGHVSRTQPESAATR